MSKLEELREKDPTSGRWPRIVAVIDEFQYLFAERDAITKTATALLEDVARRGRSQGIHLVLASQDVSGIAAFWGRQAIFEQFVLRIALPRARRVLDKANDAALDLPRWHAVVNHESGIRYGNGVVRVPDASTKGPVDEVKKRAARAVPRPTRQAAAAVRRQPRATVRRASPTVRPGGQRPPRALVGQCMDVAGSPATVPLPAAPGRNSPCSARARADATRVLGAAAASLAAALPGDPRLASCSHALVADAAQPARRRLENRLGEGCSAWSGPSSAASGAAGGWRPTSRRASRARDRSPTLVVLYGADAADTVLDRAGIEALRRVLHFGPETGVHVLGWWRSIHGSGAADRSRLG